MSFTVEGNAGGPVDAKKAQDAFRRFVRAIDKATAEGGSQITARIYGFEGSDGFSLTAGEVRIEDSDEERTQAADAEFEERVAAET